MRLKNIRIENLCGFVVTDRENPRFTLETENALENAFVSSYYIRVRSGEDVYWETEQKSSAVDNIVYGGKPLCPCTVYTVEARVTDNYGNAAENSAEFETGFLSGDFPAEWITKPNFRLRAKKSPVPLVFKKKFSLSGKVKKARLYSTAFGIYSFLLSGKEVADDRFAPGFTSYKDQLQYQVYDIAPFLEEENELVFTVAGGWAVAVFGLFKSNRLAADKIALKALVRIEYDDGRTEEIRTDESWLVTADGPVRDVSFYDGETYDATKALSEAVFENAKTDKPRLSPRLIASYGRFAKVIEVLEPKSIQKSKNGYIYDFGQNCAGVLELEIDGEKGQIITARHAEVLIDGELFTKPLRTAKAMLEYTCKGGKEVYSPKFTFMGFRYAELCGIEPEKVKVKMNVISSIDEETGDFTCSNEDLNRLQKNIKYSGFSNFLEIPTDCPQRDERLGWTGDIAVFASTACFNFNMNRFLEKWLVDVRSQQSKSGGIPVVVPMVKFFGGRKITAGWSDCIFLVPWALYQNSGDVSILRQFYPMMKRYLCGVEKAAASFAFGEKRYIWSRGFSYGDWCAPGENQKKWMAKKRWISTAYFANDCAIAEKVAKVLGFENEAAEYGKKRKLIENAYRNVFTDKKGTLKNEFQTAYVCPLYFGMVEGDERKKYAENLLKLVKKADNHLSTGFLGTPYLLFALSDNGYVKEAYDLILQDTCPSWLYEVKAGGTSIWERWDALRPDGTVNLGKDSEDGISDISGGGMVSFNHYANGAVGDWLYRRVGGIEAIEPGYKRFRIAPLPGGGLTNVSCSKKLSSGTIKSEWTVEDGKFRLFAEVPFNTSAVITLPNGETHEVQSGKYSFETDLKI